MVTRVTHPYAVEELCISPRHPLSSFNDGSLLFWARASSESPGLLSAWLCTLPSAVEGDNVVPRLRAVASAELSCSLSALGESNGRALVGTVEGQVAVYDVARDNTGVCVETNRHALPEQQPVSSVTILASAHAVVTQENGQASLLDDVLHLVRTVRLGSCITGSASGTPFVSALCTADGQLYQWDTRQAAPASAAQVCGASLCAVNASASDPWQLLSSSVEGVVRLHDSRRWAQCVSSNVLGHGPVRASFASGLPCGPVLVATSESVLGMPITLQGGETLLQSYQPIACVTYERALRVMLASSDSGELSCRIVT